MWQNYWCANTYVCNCKMWAPNTKFISLLFLFFLFEFRLSSCNSINYFSIVSCIPFFLISFSVPPFSLLNHQRYFCSFIVAESVNTTLEREFLSASICDAFSLKALNKAFIFDKAIWSDYIVLESHIQVHLSKKKDFFQNVVYWMSQNGGGLFLNSVYST